MGTTTAILKAFLDEMEAFVLENPYPMARPGVNFTPPSSGLWLESLSFPNIPKRILWDSNGFQYVSGFFQVSVFYRPGTGQIEPSQLADKIIDYFPEEKLIGGLCVSQKPWQSPAVTVDSSKLFIPVTIPYSGLIK